MKINDLMVGAAVAVAVFLAYGFMDRKRGGVSVAAQAAKLVQTWGGWQYFSDGTAIGPDGKYYFKGDLVFSPTANSGGFAGDASAPAGGVWV